MKTKNIRSVFILYWFLLAYVVAALIWWYIALMQQNDKLINLRLAGLQQNDSSSEQYDKIQNEKRRKTAQYIGEGSIFLLLISAGAIFVYRSLNQQFKLSQQQQNFMMALTHELKTPIAVTKLNLETLQKRRLDETQQHRLLQNTLQGANRMNALCNNMLISSQIEAGGYRLTKTEIDLSELVENCVTDFRVRFPARQIEAGIEPHLHAAVDGQLIEIAVNNLIDNALKYSGREEPVTVKLSIAHSILLQVEDHGPGIAESEKKKVFEKFYRLGNEATRRAKGTGLGLYLTHRIAKAHNGKIFVKDNKPSGSIFVLELAQAV